MKRNIIKAAIAAFAIIAIVSCEDKIVVPEVIPAQPVDKAGIVFTATTETAATTKTALSENGGNFDVVWRNGDQITIVDGESHVGKYTTTSTTTTADFTYIPESGAEATASPYKAWYPASLYNGGTPTLPATQTYVAGNNANAPMYATSSTTNLEFKNLTGIIRLNLTTTMSEKKVRRITLSATQGMSGAFIVSSNTAVVDGTAGVTLDCGEAGVAIGNSAIPFYIAVPATTYTDLSISVWTTDGLSQTRTLKGDKSVVVTRSGITDITLSVNNLEVNSIDVSSSNAITIPAGTFATLTGTNNNCVITVEDGATVTLDNTAVGNFIIQAKATMIFEGANTVNKGSTFITLRDDSELTVQGTGTLTGNQGMGIGGNGDLVMEGGSLNLHGLNVDNGSGTAAISIRNLTVKGGAITATGGGNWYYGDDPYNGISCAGNISIEGGSVVSNGSHGLQADGNISISGGTVEATGRGEYNRYNSGISAGGTIDISGGIVTARGANKGSCPGIGDKGTCGDIIISGGKVSAFGGGSGVGIGAGGTCGTITITGGEVTAVGGDGAAGIGAGGTCGNITISGGVVTATGGNGAAGIGTGSNANSRCGDIMIDGGYVTTYGGSAASGIGTGNIASAVCGNITIRNTVTKVISFSGEGATTFIGKGHSESTVGAITIEAGAAVQDDYDRIDLSESGTANCYIVPAEGHYKFRATVKGNGAADLASVSKNTDDSEIASAALVWSTYGTEIIPAENAIISEIGYKNGYVTFSTGLSGYEEGNAVVAIKNAGGTILWSWHLWFTNDVITAQTWPGNAVFMDRDLGALSADSSPSNYGLLYQWGRKDPFPNSKYSTVGNSNYNTYYNPATRGSIQVSTPTDQANLLSVAEVVAVPNRFIVFNGYATTPAYTWANNLSTTGGDLWATDKTIFDPCPPGWKVPSSSHFSSDFLSAYTEASYADPLELTFGGTTISFPNAGLRSSNVIMYRESSNRYTYIIYAQGEVWKPHGYHFRHWATDGALLKDYTMFNKGEIEPYSKETAGFYTYPDIVAGNPYYYPVYSVSGGTYPQYYYFEETVYLVRVGSGLSVRCVRDE